MTCYCSCYGYNVHQVTYRRRHAPESYLDHHYLIILINDNLILISSVSVRASDSWHCRVQTSCPDISNQMSGMVGRKVNGAYEY